MSSLEEKLALRAKQISRAYFFFIISISAKFKINPIQIV